MRIRFLLGGVALAGLWASAAAASSLAFEDNKIHMKGCDGSVVAVRWRDDNFSLTLLGVHNSQEHASFKFVGWGGGCENVRWDSAKGAFSIGDDGNAKNSQLLRFMAPDQSKWVAMRHGDGFYTARIAEKGEDASNERIADVAAWLKRTNSGYAPGAKLGNYLIEN